VVVVLSCTVLGGGTVLGAKNWVCGHIMPVVKTSSKRKFEIPVEEVKCDIAPHMEEEDIGEEDCGDLIEEFEAVMQEVKDLVAELAIAFQEDPFGAAECMRLEKSALCARSHIEGLVALMRAGFEGGLNGGRKSC